MGPQREREREREREGPEAGKAARSISAFVVTVHTASWLVSEGGATGVSPRGVELFAGARIWSSETVLVQPRRVILALIPSSAHQTNFIKYLLSSFRQ